MTVKASATVTLSSVVDVKSVWRYYILQASTLSKPSKPTINPPSGWTTTEPSYTYGSTDSLYFCDLTVFSDNTFVYSDVSLSSSYEAAKAAYNKAVAADDKAQDAKDTVNNMEIGGRNMLRGSSFKGLSQVDNTYMKYKNNSVKLTVDNINGTSTKFASIDTLKQSWDLSDVLGKTLTISMWIYIEEVGQLAGYEFRIVYSADGTKYWDKVDKTYPYYKPKANALKVGWNYVYACYTIPINATEAYFSFTCYAIAGKTSTAWFSSPKAEIGNKPTDWTPAPEDMATADDVTQLVTRVTNAETSITNNQNEIKLRATKTEVTEVKSTADTAKSTADSVEKNLADNYSTTAQIADIYTTQTEMTQTSEEIRMDFTKSISSASNALQSQMEANDEATNQKLSEINKYIRFVDGTIVLGETGNRLVLTIQNKRVSFTQSGVEVAYFSDNNLFVNRATIVTSMKIGNYEFTPRTDGGLALRKTKKSEQGSE